jgi:hypothetical protein
VHRGRPAVSGVTPSCEDVSWPLLHEGETAISTKERRAVALEPLQLREETLPVSVVLVRQGAITLNDDKLARSCESTQAKWGIAGFSVQELPVGGFDELARLAPILRKRSRVLVAESAGLLADGFPLFPTGTHPRWTVVLSEATPPQFSRVRAHFTEQANPSYDRRG